MSEEYRPAGWYVGFSSRRNRVHYFPETSRYSESLCSLSIIAYANADPESDSQHKRCLTCERLQARKEQIEKRIGKQQ